MTKKELFDRLINELSDELNTYSDWSEYPSELRQFRKKVRLICNEIHRENRDDIRYSGDIPSNNFFLFLYDNGLTEVLNFMSDIDGFREFVAEENERVKWD